MSQYRVTASSLNVRRMPSPQEAIIGTLSQDDIGDYLETSGDQKWLKVQKDDLIGWSSQKYLVEFDPGAVGGSLDELIQIAGTSAIATYDWPDRGVAPRGYIKGMALSFARVYCKLKVGDENAVDMAQADTGDSETDALAYYANEFDDLGMNNDASGEVTLRHLFVLLLGLGMRESSGRWCEGRDRSTNNTTGPTAEAGLFQVSWNARTASPLLTPLFNEYRQNPSGFSDVFQEGVTPTSQDLENFGTGNGKEFQRLCKECPAFAAEFAAIGLRHIRSHWGPIIHHAAELRPEADRMFLRIQNAVDTSNLCADLL